MALLKMTFYRMQHIMVILIQLYDVFVRAHLCKSTYSCLYANTEGASPIYQEFKRPGRHSCLWFCMQDPSCEAVTHDQNLDICRFHFEADDIPCLQMVPTSGMSLWVITEYSHHNARCYMVTYMEIVHIKPNFIANI